MAYWIIRQKAINVFVPGALSCNDPLRKTLSRVMRVGSDTFGDPFNTYCLGMNYYVNFWGGIGSNGFHINEFSAIEKIEILGAVLELPAKQHCQFGPFGPILR